MKQTTKRTISILLTVLMLVSMLPIYTFAANNYVPDEEYYNEIVNDSVIVNQSWEGYTHGQKVEYYFRNKMYSESFDENIHFSSIEAAITYCNDNNVINPVIILCPGVYNGNMTITKDVTFLGTNAGIDPNVKTNDNTPWTANADMNNFTSMACNITLDKYIHGDVEVVFDGIKFINGFCYYEAGIDEFSSGVVVRNSVFDNIGAPVVNQEALTSVFYFEKATKKSVDITFDNVRVEKLSVSLIGNYVRTLDVSDMYYGDCTASLTADIDAYTNINPDYSFTDCMFYNNVTEFGVLVFDHSQKDSTTRTKTSLEISGCKFIDGPANSASKDKMAPYMTYVIAGAKNIINIHDTDFIAAKDQVAAPIVFSYKSQAISAVISDSVFINNNRFIGYPNLIDTSGLLKQSKLDFTGNFFADASGKQVDPVYPSSSSHNNIVMDYFWINSEKTVPSSIFHITSLGTTGYQLKNAYKTISLELDQNASFDFKIKTNDASTKYKVYADKAMTQEVKSLDSAQLYTGFEKNVFYAVGTSTKAPGYKFIYTMYVSTYNPQYASEFKIPNTYMYTPEVKNLAKGTAICKDWDGTSYKFIVGKTIFGTPEEIFKIADVPTILIPAGTYTENFCVTESAMILGAKHGINPNVPDFDNFERGWAMNPERATPDKETTFENCVIYISTSAENVVLEIDGITLGEGSKFSDMGEKLNTYTTTTLRNININNAGGTGYVEKDANGKEVARSSGNILHFGGTGDDFKDNHKDVRLINVRFENQSTYYLIGAYMESLYIDGLYFAGTSKRVTPSEITSPKTQNFKLEVRNSFFYNCTVSSGGGVMCVTNKDTDTPEREYNKVIYDHNLFYQPSTYQYGVIGIRFFSNRDSFYFTNNTVISTYAAHSLMPGNSGWFTGNVACENLTLEQQENSETVTDVIIKFNRICGPYKPVDKQNVKYDTCWDYSYNYVCDLDATTTVGGNFEGGIFDRTTPGIQMKQYSETQKNYMKCTTYFSDWDMTDLVNAPDSFKTELDYTISSPGKITKVDDTNFNYTDSVPAGTSSYKFDITLKTQQASYGVYSDVDCTNKLSDTVTLDKNTNVFYIRFASYKNTVVHTYKVTITKALSSEANILAIDNHSVSGNKVTAIVPVGTTSLLLKNIELSNGATYKIFNDAAKTKPFLVTKITNISEAPTYKYIEVTSEDKSTVKDYVFTVKQGANTLADITSIKNAVKVGDKAFEAYIPVEANSFELIPTASNGATVSVLNEGRSQIASESLPCMIYNVGNSKKVTITVTSETGAKNTFTLTILKDQSNAEISYIYNMYNSTNSDSLFYSKVNGATFDLKPVFKNTETTYKLYTNEGCTKAYTADTLYLTKANNTFYMKSTSPDKTSSKVYTLVIDTNNPAPAPNTPSTPDTPENPNTPSNPGTVTDITKVFTDVKKGSWYEEYVKYAYENGLFSGTSATTFDPNGTMTRAQFVRVIANFAGVKVDNNVKSSFSDVKSGQWYTGAIEWAYTSGVVGGVGDGKFDPDAKITREQMCVMIVNASEKYLKVTLPETVAPVTFTDDAKISSWAKVAVAKCQKAGLVSGVGNGAFSPEATATRAEGATLFTNCHKLWKTK